MHHAVRAQWTDLLVDIQKAFWDYGIALNARPALPVKFRFANRSEDVSTGLFPVPILELRVVVTFRVLNVSGPLLLGEDAHESLKLVIGHETGEVHSKALQCGVRAERI